MVIGGTSGSIKTFVREILVNPKGSVREVPEMLKKGENQGFGESIKI